VAYDVTVGNTGTKIHGKNGAIYLFGPKGSAQGHKAVAKAEWTLSLNRDYVDATVFGDGNKTYLVGLKDISGTYGGLLDVSGDLMLAMVEEDSIDIYFYADDREGLEVLVAHGPGLCDASITASNTDAVRMTGNFRASGLWTIVKMATVTGP
jgi:hypothetical protein